MTAPAIDITRPLDAGAHDSIEKGYCAMELVAYVAGEPFSDHPKCTSPVIGAFLRSMNDRLDDEKRQLLWPYLVECDADGRPIIDANGMAKPGRVVGTNTGKADDEIRSWMCVDWLAHEYAPAMFRFAGMTEQAETMEGLATIVDPPTWDAVRTTIYAVREQAWERREAALVKLRAVADAAAGAVADAAAAAGAVAVAAAAADAGAAAAAGAAAVADAGAAAAADVWREAVAAAKNAGSDYWDQRNAAYRVLLPHFQAKLKPVSDGLLESSLQLLDRLIDVGKAA